MRINKKQAGGISQGTTQPPTVLCVAGEASGDQHAAAVVSALRNFCPGVSVFGMGGSRLREVGMETVVDSEQSAGVMGFSELGGKIAELRRARTKLLAEVAKRKPDVALLVDFPDFNQILGRSLKKQGIQVFYFICPQMWAWRRGRAKFFRKFVDKLAVIFPFEESFCLDAGIDAQYVGHPFLDRPPLNLDRRAFLKEHGLDPDKPVVALLPGSRAAEVRELLPLMGAGAQKVAKVRTGLQLIVPVAHTIDSSEIKAYLGDAPNVVYLSGEARQALEVADVAVVASGTATVEAALARVPFFVVYRMNKITYYLARLLVRGVDFFAMPNLIAGQKIVDEFLQNEVSADSIARELERLLGDPVLRANLRDRLGLVEKRLRRGADTSFSAGQRTARLLLDLVGWEDDTEQSSSSLFFRRGV